MTASDMSTMNASSEPNNSEGAGQDTEQLQKERDEAMNGWKRALADYQNLKKDMEASAERVSQLSQVRIFLDLLPIVHDLEQVYAHIPQNIRDDSWAVGFLQVQKKLDDLMQTYHVEKIATVGEIFDPNLHEAVGYEDAPSARDHEILKEVKPGYRFNGEVLVPSQVVVNQKK